MVKKVDLCVMGVRYSLQLLSVDLIIIIEVCFSCLYFASSLQIAQFTVECVLIYFPQDSPSL